MREVVGSLFQSLDGVIQTLGGPEGDLEVQTLIPPGALRPAPLTALTAYLQQLRPKTP